MLVIISAAANEPPEIIVSISAEAIAETASKIPNAKSQALAVFGL